jgi:hypothetical protein
MRFKTIHDYPENVNENNHSNRGKQARQFLNQGFFGVFLVSVHDDDAERLGTAARSTISRLTDLSAGSHDPRSLTAPATR